MTVRTSSRRARAAALATALPDVAGRRARMAYERARWGGEPRRRVLERLLLGHYRSRFRREWALATHDTVPHFFDHRINAVEIAFGAGTATSWLRAFYTLEVLRSGDRMLDIGCGDGFFDRHFFVDRCAAIDAIDVEESAITHAVRCSAHERITYARLDATVEPFPSHSYDVVAFDGAIGHFAAETTDAVVAKVAAALEPGGVFVGSESLGREGGDHLQFFEGLADLAVPLTKHFPVVALREVEYVTPTGLARREGFWRCASSDERIVDGGWQRFSSPVRRA